MSIPECWCDKEAMASCDWVFEAQLRYYRKGHEDDAVMSTIPWKLENIPAPLAQVIIQGMVDAMNKRGLETYVGWIKATCGSDEEAAKVVKMLESVVNQS